jgi:hypothetical protein
MASEVILIGMGEMGGVFARGFLKDGYAVIPVLKKTNMEDVARRHSDPRVVVVAVGEAAFQNVISDLPVGWKDRLLFLQNELLPRDWVGLGIKDPTVISVWFEKKYPMDYKEIIPSPVFGSAAEYVESALGCLGLHCERLSSEDELLFELIAKNLYILTVNIAGIRVGGTVDELWENHEPLARAVGNDILDIQFALCGRKLDREGLFQRMQEAFRGDPAHQCKGRSAPERLKRALQQAESYGLTVSTLKSIAQEIAG